MSQTVKLDLKDRKILSILDWDARATNSEIAKKVRLSKKGVEYRIKKLEEKGVIQGYYPVIDFMKLGYLGGRAFISIKHYNEELRKKLERFIIKQKETTWLVKTRGQYDYVIAVWSLNIEDIKKLIIEIRKRFDKFIKEVHLTLVTRLDQYPSKFLLERYNPRALNIRVNNFIEKIDLFDYKIIRELLKNSRQSFSDMGKKINRTYKFISNRIKKLENKEILLGFRAIINHELIDYTYYKIFISLKYDSKESVKKIEFYLKEKLETIYMMGSIGGYDLEAEFMFPSNYDFFEFIEELQSEFPELIKEVNHTVYLETLKIKYLPISG